MQPHLSYRPYRRPFRQPLRTARGLWAEREGYVLRLERGGRVSYGEVAPLPAFGTETFEAAGALLARLAADPRMPLPAEAPCCRFAWSAAYEALSTDPVPIPAELPVAGLLPSGRAALEQGPAKAALGYRSLKWKIGVEPPATEIALAAELLDRLPAHCRLRLDANAGFEADEAALWVEFMAGKPGRFEFLEQPLPVGEEAAMARLAADSGVAIALDESLNGPAGTRWLAPGAWSGPLVIKPLLMGDLGTLREQLRPVAGQLVFSSVFETAVGLHQVVALLATLPPIRWAAGFDTLDAFDDGLSAPSAGPKLVAAQILGQDLDQLWNQLPATN